MHANYDKLIEDASWGRVMDSMFDKKIDDYWWHMLEEIIIDLCMIKKEKCGIIYV